MLAGTTRPLHLTPMTRDRAKAAEWLKRFEGAGLDGVIAKPEDLPYMPGKRAMFKIKHARTADVVVAGYREHKQSTRERPLLGSLLLGLYNEEGQLQHIGVSASFTEARRAELIEEYTERFANPYIAAERGYVDSVIPPSYTRSYVIKALRALRSKREVLPPKKHGNIPL